MEKRDIVLSMISRRFASVLFLCIIFFVIAHCSPKTDDLQDDYLTPDLRVRVDQLKKDAIQEKTTQDTFAERCDIMWDWSNALSRTGATLNPDLPAFLVPLFDPDIPVSENRLKRIDMLINELSLHDEFPPESFGTLHLDKSGPFRAGSYQTIEQTFTVGDIAVEEGGGFLIGRHFQSYEFPAGTNFQAHDLEAEGYVTARCSNPAAQFNAERIPWVGIHGIAEVGTSPVVFRLLSSRLERGQTLTVTYGDISGGSKGMRIQDYSNDSVPLPVYVDFNGDGNFVVLPIQAYSVVGGEAFSVHGFAPSVVSKGEPFSVTVRSEDRYYNKATGPIPAYDVRMNGKHFRSIDAGDSAINLLEGIQFSKPGIYRFSFHSPGGKLLGRCNPVWVKEEPGLRIYWGDMHSHSGFAEGLGTPESLYRFGRDEARLDFLAHSEHDIWMDDYEWDVLRNNVAKFTEEGKFIAFLGYEWTKNIRHGGHHNVYFRSHDGRKRVPIQEVPDLEALHQRLAEENELEDVLVVPHAHEPGDWHLSHPGLEHLIEIASGHGNFEWFGQRFLAAGHQVGFIACSDDHFCHPGYSPPFLYGYMQSNGLTAVLAQEKTSDVIFDALRARRCYATTGQRIIIDMELNGIPMGTLAEFSHSRRISGRVIGTSPIDTITLVKNGQDISTEEFLTTVKGQSQIAEVSFWSESAPQNRDRPHAWRRWAGMLNIKNARLVRVSSPSLNNRILENVHIDTDNPQTVNFVFLTRGSKNSILLELEDSERDSMIDIALQPAPESEFVFYERLMKRYFPQIGIVSPSGRAHFLFQDFGRGPSSQIMTDGPSQDVITVRWVRRGAPMDREFLFVDEDNPLPGDSYYVRITQLDGGVAWSSPIWVGDTSLR